MSSSEGRAYQYQFDETEDDVFGLADEVFAPEEFGLGAGSYSDVALDGHHLLLADEANGQALLRTDATSGAQGVAVSPDGTTVYLARPGDDSLSVFERSTSGQPRLTPVQTVVFDLRLQNPRSVAVSSDGNRVFVGGHQGVLELARQPDGRLVEVALLTRITAQEVTQAPTDLLWNANRSVLYTACPHCGHIYVDDLPAGGGTARPTAVALSPAGDILYVTDAADASVLAYSVGPDDGRPKALIADSGPVVGLGGASSVTASPDGRFVFATGATDDSLVVLEHDKGAGRLLPVQRLRNGSAGVEGLRNPVGVEVTPDGRHVHVAAAGEGPTPTGGVSTFEVATEPPDPAVYDVRHHGFEQLNVQSGDASDDVYLGEVDPPVAGIETFGGNDEVDLAKTAGGRWFVNTGAGADHVDLRATGPDADVDVLGEGGPDRVNVWSTQAGTDTDIDLGAGDDTLDVTAPSLESDVSSNGSNHDGGDTLVLRGRGTQFETCDGGSFPAEPPPDGTVRAPEEGSACIDYAAFELFDVLAPPIADAGGPYTLAEGGSLSLDAGDSFEPSGRAVTYSWDLNGDGRFGDVTGARTGLGWEQLVGLGIDDDGERVVTVRATDDQGEVSESSATVVVTNTEPTATMTGGGSVADGVASRVELAYADPGDDTVDGVRINWGDGNTETVAGAPAVAEHVYEEPGQYTAKLLSITDEDGTVDFTQPLPEVGVTVTEVVPVEIAGRATVDEGQEYALELYGPADVTGWTVSWGDGNTEALAGGDGAIARHTFDGPAVATIDAVATFADGTTEPAEDQVTVLVANVDPEISVTGEDRPDEGLYTLGFSATDPGPDTITGWRVDWGDGTAETFDGTATGATHVFDGKSVAPTPYDIVVEATDEDGTYTAPAKRVQVSDLSPFISSIDVVPPNPTEGSTATVAVEAGDLGPDDVVVEFDFDGDGTYEVATVDGVAEHLFDDDGTYPVGVQVDDGDGFPIVDTVDVTVANVAPTATLRLDGLAAVPTASGAPAGPVLTTVEEDDPVTLGVDVIDPGDDTVTGYTVDWGDGTVEEITDPSEPPVHRYAGTKAGTTYDVTVTELTDEDGTHPAASTISLVVTYVDRIAPETSIDRKPSRFTDADEVTVEFSGIDDPRGSAVADLTFACRLDDAEHASPCTSPFTVDNSDGRPHTLEVAAVDEQANADPTPEVVEFGFDRPPGPGPEPEPEPEPEPALLCDDDGTPPPAFSDVSPADVHADNIARAAACGLTRGTSATTFSPNTSVTREQVASFVARLLTEAGIALPEDPPNAFDDDDTSVHHLAINQVAALGIIEGRSAGAYEPDGTLTRAQLAALAVRTYERLTGEAFDATEDHFADDDTSVHEDDINAAFELDIVDGTDDGGFSPRATIPRDQTASILMRLVDQLNAAGVDGGP